MTWKKNPLKSLGAWSCFLHGRSPGQVVIQYTDKCNASCAQCGMRISNDFPRTKMDPEKLKPQLDAMAAQGVQSISFTGGEPLLFLDEVVELAEHASKAGIPYIRTGTNGFIFRGSDRPGFMSKISKVAEKLANSPINTFWVSIDSSDPEIHEKNRGLSGVVKGIEKGLEVFHDHGLYPSANLGINRLTGGHDSRLWPEKGVPLDTEIFYQGFCDAFSRFYSFVESLGFTIANGCYPMSVTLDELELGAVYAATSTEDFIKFTLEERKIMFRALRDTAAKWRSRIRIFTPLSSLLMLERQCETCDPGPYPCRGGIDYFFIDSDDMHAYPCGYRGAESLGRFDQLDMKSLKQEPFCSKCDWECFRDPSVVLGPVLDLFSKPQRLIPVLAKDREFAKLWFKDIRYYHACGYFNARQAPKMDKLSKFKAASMAPAGAV